MRGRLLILAPLATLFFATGARAAVYVYWGNAGTNSIGRAATDGATTDPNFIPGTGSAYGLATDKSHIYWADALGDRIGRANIDGTDPQPSFIPGFGTTATDYTDGVAVDSGHIYWSNTAHHTIGRANLDGSGVDQNFATLTPDAYPNGLAVDGSFIYWADYLNGRIGRASIADGGGVAPNFVTGADHPSDVAVDGSFVYWTNTGSNAIGRAGVADGTTGKTQVFLTGLSDPCGLALDIDFQNIWWSNQSNGTLGRANLLDGSGRSDSAVSGLSEPCGLDVDHGFLIPTTTPSNTFSFGKLKRNRKKGTAKLPVTVPGPGMLTLTGKGVKPQRPAGATGRSRARTVGAAGTVSLRIVARGKAKKKLARTGSAKLKLTITFTPNGGTANAQPKTVRLKKR